MESSVLSSFGGNLAAMALAGGLYFGFRGLKRSTCHSHNKCCDFDIAKAETERDDRIFLRIIESFKKEAIEDGAAAVQVDNARALQSGPGHEGNPV